MNLKRFNIHLQKITTPVSYPLENLSIPNIVAVNNLKVNKNVHYKLFAVINHIGGNCMSGHYTLFLKKVKKWFKFVVLSTNAYTVVYIENKRFKELGA